jgi:hypothetical protein
MTVTSKLILWKGFQSAYTLGLAPGQPSDPTPESIDLLNGTFTVSQVGGSSSWTPTIAVPKAGLWGDSATSTGRIPVVQPIANAIEEMELTTSNRAAAWSALSTLNRFAQAAREYWEGVSPDPVMIEWQAVGAPGSQWAVIYPMDVSFSEVEVLIDDALTEAVSITLAFEREPAWRPIAFGANPKLWTFYTRGLQPTSSDPAPTGYYNYTHLALNAGVGDYAQLIEAQARNIDELGVDIGNKITIPASQIPGDAPALFTATFGSPAGVPLGGVPFYVAVSSNRDYFPANNAVGVIENSRLRTNYNAGDATIASATNITLTKPITADGLFSNGSIANRYVVQIAMTGATATPGTMTWLRRAAQAQGRYAVFMRASVTAGVATDAQVIFRIAGQAEPVELPPYRLNPTLSANRGGTHYLGTISLNDATKTIVSAGYNSPQTQRSIQLSWTRAGAANVTVVVWDVILMPIDGGMITFNTNKTPTYDSTGMLMPKQPNIFTLLSEQAAVPSGQTLTLTPRTDNHLFLFGVRPPTLTFPATQLEAPVFINILPRWYGVRDA